MKLTKVISAVMVATTLAGTMAIATPDLTAQANTKMSLKTIPKQFRGTWYHYEKADGYDYQKISATKIKSHVEKKNNSRTIHQFDLNKGIKETTKNLNNAHKWMYAYKSGSKYIMDSWETYPVLQQKDRSWYQMTTRAYKGKKVKVIKIHQTNSVEKSWLIYSPSKALAKHLWNLDNK